MRTILVAAAALAAGTSLSLAQTAYTEVEDDTMIVMPFNISADDLEDMDVVGANGEEIGEVEDVLMNASGAIAAVSVEVGGFLGIGESEVVFPLDQLKLQGDDLVTSLTQEQVEALEDWAD
ncbi:PRC-barrel domain-containing protein [Aquibium oceanicum]|uniref:PRC-barrel domain-containing protein n=1 Tax=Aquibium oceanicum TaxID=1670800 RepID=A0A1L3SPE3_9HYPH|nr:PRC-barrel domain-containing protein [Aquibium oceanicum]APH71283.1 hypothetical protein BSQ44_07760 [Aquibium oceanicum]